MFYFHWGFDRWVGLVVFVGLIGFAFVIWMLVDAIVRTESDFSSPGAKTGWIVGLILGLVFGFGFLGLIVALAYLSVVRIPARSRERSARIQAPAAQTFPASPAPGTPTAPGPPPPGGPQAAAIYCRACGAKLVAGARFCHSCGTPV